jgi:hypothetical protein
MKRWLLVVGVLAFLPAVLSDLGECLLCLERLGDDLGFESGDVTFSHADGL